MLQALIRTPKQAADGPSGIKAMSPPDDVLFTRCPIAGFGTFSSHPHNPRDLSDILTYTIIMMTSL